MCSLGIVITVQAATPACPNVDGSVNQGHNQNYNNAICVIIQDCAAHSARCNASPCNRCSGPNILSYCLTSEEIEGGPCHEVETACGNCFVGGLCDMITHTCSGGQTQDADGDNLADLCYVKKCF
jgi:hypothetical protein